MDSTNDADTIKIKNRLGGISKVFCLCSYANMAVSDKYISQERKFLTKFYPNFMN